MAPVRARALAFALLLCASARAADDAPAARDPTQETWYKEVDHAAMSRGIGVMRGVLTERGSYKDFTPADWARIVREGNLGPNEIKMIEHRYGRFGFDASALAPPDAARPPSETERDPSGGRPVDDETVRKAGGNPATGRPSSASPGKDGDESAEDKSGESEEGNKPEKERQIEHGDVDRIQSKALGILGQKDALWGPDRERETLPPGGGGAEARGRTKGPASGQADASPSFQPGPGREPLSGAPEDPRDAALAAIARYKRSGTGAASAGGYGALRTSSVPPLRGIRRRGNLAAAGVGGSPSGGYLSGVSAGPMGEMRAPAEEKSGGESAGGKKAAQEPSPKRKTPFGELTEEEEKELQEFLDMIDAVAATGVLDSDSANGKLVDAEAKTGPDSDLNDELDAVRTILERAGRNLTMEQQAIVLGAAKRLGFRFNSKQAWNLLRALEKGYPPPPKIVKKSTLWERIVRFFKRLFVKIASAFD